MSIKQVKEVPNYRTSFGDIKAFIESGWDFAEVELNGRNAKNVYINMRQFALRRGIKEVKVVKRGEHVYLVRKGDE